MTRNTRFDRFSTDDRSTSEVVAMALLLGIVMLGISAILLVSVGELSDDQESVEVDQAEQALVQFDDDASRVAMGSTSSQEVDLGLRINRGTLDVDEEAGHITVRYVDFFESENTTEVMNTTLGAVEYESGDTSVAYQGGGVWRRDGNGSVMVSPPEIETRGGTLTMPVVKTNRNGSVHSDVQIRGAEREQRFPNETAHLTNRLEDTQIEIVIESKYYRAWYQFFRDDTDAAIVDYNDKEERVSVLFMGGLPTHIAPSAGVIATSGPGELELAASSAYVDSYNSDTKPYEQHAADETTEGIVKAAGDIDMAGGSEIKGDTHSGKTIIMRGGSRIVGDAFAHEEINQLNNNAEVTGNKTNGTDTIPHIPPLNDEVESNVTRLQNPENNSNDETTVIENNELNITGDQRTLDGGEYYLDNLTLETDTLILNVTEENITIAVRDWMSLLSQGQDGSHIEVEGDGHVRFYMASEDAFDVTGAGQGRSDLDKAHLYVEDNSSIHVPGDRSPRFVVYGKQNFLGATGGDGNKSPNVTAAIIAPAGLEGTGKVLVQKSDVFGTIITGNLTANEGGRIHFDRALMDREIVPLAPQVPRIEYLYLTENEIEVKSS